MTTANLTITDTETVIQYTSVGETAFLYDFPILSTDEIRVSIDQVLKTLGVDFTVSGVGDAGGGTVTFLSATTIGESITIWQDMPFKRLTGFATGAAVLAGAALNTEFARQVRHDQQIRREIGLAIRLATDDPLQGQDMVIPSQTDRVGKFLAFDATGKPTTSLGSGGGDTSLRSDLASSVANNGAALIGDPKPFATAFLQTLSDIINGVDISILRFITTANGEHAKIRGRTSITNHTADFNNAITELNATSGGRLIVPFGDYNAEDIVPKNTVTIVGDHLGIVTPSTLLGSRIVSLGNGSHIFNQSAGTLTSFALSGLVLQGPGAATAGRGMSFVDADRLHLSHIAFNNFADEALLLSAGNAAEISRLFAQNCLLDRTRAAKIGVIHLLGSDHLFSVSEITASSLSLSDANQFICAVFLGGSNHFIHHIVGEISDVGIHAACTRSRITAVRADLNLGHGFELVGTGNIISASHFLNNGQAAANTHSGFRATGGSNLIGLCISDGVTANQHKFGFEDTINSDTTKNQYSDCLAFNFGTKSFSNVAFAGSVMDFSDQGPSRPFVNADTTPSVDQYNSWRFVNTGATSVTTFDDGVSGQLISLIGDANTTLVNGATLKTNTGANKALSANTMYRLKLNNGVWIEQE